MSEKGRKYYRNFRLALSEMTRVAIAANTHYTLESC